MRGKVRRKVRRKRVVNYDGVGKGSEREFIC